LKRGLLLLAALALAIPAWAQNTNDTRDIERRDGRDWDEIKRRSLQEGEVPLPAMPKKEDLVEFWVSNSTAFRFFIDTASLSVDFNQSVVRYTLVARSPSGVTNVTYEGMRCPQNQYKIYAHESDGKWRPANADWKSIEPNAIARWHNELKFRYFCVEKRGSLMTREEGIDALRRGGHPGAAGRAGY
jgi:hypothetical protein